MAKARGNEQAWLGGARNPSTFDWIVAIFVVAVQIGLVMAVNALFIEPDPTRMKNVDQRPRKHGVRRRKFGFYSDRV